MKTMKYKVAALIVCITLLTIVIGLGVFLHIKKQEGGFDESQSSQVESVEKDTSPKEDNTEQNDQTESDSETELDSETESISETELGSELETEGIEDFTMFFTGDIMLDYRVLGVYDKVGINGLVSEYVHAEMQAADLTVVNQEFTFSTRGTPMPDKQFTFRIDPKYVSVFQELGVDVVSLANNHSLDFGTEALLDSFTTLDNAGIPYVGAGNSIERAEEAIFVESNGRKVGVLSASRVIPVVEWNVLNRQPGLFCTYSSNRMVKRIQEIKEQCDFVVVYVHWGEEKKEYPEEFQRILAKEYIDAGADLVVGNHAHVPQGIEYYKGVPIVYCLGNFIFYPNMVNTYALKVVYHETGNVSIQVIPVGVKNALTKELSAEKTEEFYNYIEEISFGVTIDEKGFVTEATE